MEDDDCKLFIEIKTKLYWPLIVVSLANIPIRGLFDTGADISSISKAVFKRLQDRLKVNLLKKLSKCTSAF
jgi:hypothetical protein